MYYKETVIEKQMCRYEFGAYKKRVKQKALENLKIVF